MQCYDCLKMSDIYYIAKVFHHSFQLRSKRKFIQIDENFNLEKIKLQASTFQILPGLQLNSQTNQLKKKPSKKFRKKNNIYVTVGATLWYCQC